MKNSLIIISIIFLSTTCDKNKNEFIKEIKIDNSTSTECYFFNNRNSDTLKFLRKIEIVKNTIKDTILIGNTILPPNYLGELEYTQFEDKVDIVLDLRYMNPPADRLCINSYKNKNMSGILKVKLNKKD